MHFLTLFTLLFLCASQFSETGYMKAWVEKNWLISVNDSEVREVVLNGFFLVNNSNQRVLELETNGKVLVDGELIKIRYETQHPELETIVYARALVEISYPTQFSFDPPVPFSPVLAYGAANFTPEIAAEARNEAKHSSLATIASLASWVHKNIRYNISYLNKSIPASEVFRIREGVCTEYSHLLMAMLSSLGLRSRFVSGYVYQNGSSHAHAWVEVFLANETIAVDPTFGEVGGISANHVAMFYSGEQISSSKVDFFYSSNHSGAFDVINARGGSGFNLSVNVSITPIEMRDFPLSASLSYNYDNSSGKLEILIHNPTTNYLIFSYSFKSPDEFYGSDSRIITISPGEKIVFTYMLNQSALRDDYKYTIPFIVSIQGSKLNTSVKYIKTQQPLRGTCVPALFLPMLVLISFALVKKH